MTDPAGLLEKGNIDLLHRPVVKNDDGTISTVRSMSFEEDGSEILVPTVSPDGKILSDEDAISRYRSTGQHLGKFRSADEANTYAEQLHEDQAKRYGDRPKPDPWRGWNLPDPSNLRNSVSGGPQSWGEAITDLASSRNAADTIINNSNADYPALERAYDAKIARIRDLTDVELPNPLRTNSAVDRDMADILSGQSQGNGITPELFPDYFRRKDEEFNTAAAALADRDPKVAGIIGKPILDQRNEVMKDAEAKAQLAAKSPELGMLGRFTGDMAGGLMAASKDPVQWSMAAFGAGGSAAKSVAGRVGQTLLTEALLNGGQEAVLQAASQERKKAAGLEYGLEDALKNVGVAATFGALFGGSVEGAGELWHALRSRPSAGASAASGSAPRVGLDNALSSLGRDVTDEEGIAATARVIEGKPNPGDVELVAKAMGVELGPERLDMINRSFEDRVLDDVTLPADATPEQMRVFEAAHRYAEDPDNHPPPELVERLLADEEATRSQFSPDDYERMFAGDQNAIDDIGDTFFASEAARGADAAAAAPRNGVRGFQTEKGSTYVVEGKSTTRNKAARDLPGHEGDFGAKPASELTIYVDENAGALSAAGLNGLDERGARVALRDGQANLVTWNKKANGWGASEGSRNIPYHLEPAVGRYPLELWRAADDVPGHTSYSRMHAGNKIVSVVEDVPDPIEGQRIRPAEAAEPLDDAAMVQAERDAGEIVEPARDANGNPENYLDFIGVEDGDGNVKIMSTAEALAMADEPDRLAAVLESCRL